MRGESHEGLGWQLREWHWNSTWRKGHHQGPFPFFFCLLSTVLPYLSVFADIGTKYISPTPKCDSNRSNFMKNVLMLFLIFFWATQVASCRFITPIFNSAIYWRKEIRKDEFVFVRTRSWTGSSAREFARLWVRVKREKLWGRQREREWNMRKEEISLNLLWKTVRHKDEAKVRLHLQSPATKRHTHEGHPWWPTGTSQWLQWSGDGRYKTADLFRNIIKYLHTKAPAASLLVMCNCCQVNRERNSTTTFLKVNKSVAR